MIRFAVPFLAIAMLTACGDDPEPVMAGADERAAEGDVLEGSISDEMLPLDRLQSKSPPAERSDDSDENSGSGGAAPVAAEPEEPVAAEEPEPAEETPAESPETEE